MKYIFKFLKFILEKNGFIVITDEDNILNIEAKALSKRQMRTLIHKPNSVEALEIKATIKMEDEVEHNLWFGTRVSD